MNSYIKFLYLIYLALFLGACNRSIEKTEKIKSLLSNSSNFEWITQKPLIESDSFGEEDWIAMKDPSLVKYNDTWHLFCTLRGHKRSHAIVYSSFDNLDNAGQVKPIILPNHDGYFCAPQVFYFTPHEKWYLICQASDSSWTPKYQASYATSSNISDPYSWSSLKPLGVIKPENIGGLDFWIICNEEKAYIFFTSNNGRMWREETKIEAFPYGWSEPEIALEADIFEASHIYRIDKDNIFLNLIEAQYSNGRRYYKAFISKKLDGEWIPLAADSLHAYASMLNVTQLNSWTNSISHGELIRSGYDEKLKAELNAPFIFQGVLEKDRTGKKYGEIPWKLGILEPQKQ